MDEELNENELDERLYSMLHYSDDTQENLKVNQTDVVQIVDVTPRIAVRRYWRSSDEHSIHKNNNIPNAPPSNNNNETENTNSKAESGKHDCAPSPTSAKLLSFFQSPVSQNLKKTVEIIENDEEYNQIVALESSDEDEVVEVALPPKPTITIESSDEDEVCAINEEKHKQIIKETTSQGQISPSNERDVAASPVPSIVSSVSDDFIRGDCIALNISSRHPNNQSFDFSLHGSDLLVQTPSKKKKKKKNKDPLNTSTPIASTPVSNATTSTDKEECFATPKSKANNKKQKNKSYLVSAKSLPNADVYDSDSNQSGTESNKSPSNTEVNKGTDIDLVESNLSGITVIKPTMINAHIRPPEKNSLKDKNEDDNPKTSKPNICITEEASNIVDLTDSPDQEKSLIENDNIVMGNVTGFSQVEEYDMNLSLGDAPKYGSTKVPAILYADLDFNNLNGKEKASKKRRYSLTTLRAEMEKFYNESWGGENFNHREIQKYMSRDKSLWVIDPKDRISAFTKRKVTCNYCNRQGHRDDTCRLKPPVCYMCGSMGHNEPRCPTKICVNCGSPNHMYSSMCRNCCHWHGITCAECGQSGHPASHCPDLWRRYHNTISEDTPLEENNQMKKHYQMFCSGCTRRGHLVHTCRVTVPFSGLPINSPYVTFYNPIYPLTNVNQFSNPASQPAVTTQHKNTPQDDTVTCGLNAHRADRNKRQSKSPVIHESHVNKKRNLSGTETTDIPATTKSSVNTFQKKKTSQNKDILEDNENTSKNVIRIEPKIVQAAEQFPDYIPVCSGNHDKQGQIIQDNEVSNTSEVITAARIYVTGEIMDKLNTVEGLDWLNKTAEKNNVTIQKTDIISFLIIKGTIGNQDAFQAEMRDWIKNQVNAEYPKSDQINDSALCNDQSLSDNIPKKRNNVLRVINRALDSLNDDIGDPKTLFKELNYLQNRHLQLLKQKGISSKQLLNNRTNIKSIFRKLNMVLLGQAGLADGSKHLNELYTLYEKITNFRQKVIPLELRQEIGQHFHSIFTATPREDYPDLLSKYYISRNTQLFSKKNRNNTLKLNPKPKQNKNINQPLQNNSSARIDKTSEGGIVDFKNSTVGSKPLIEKTINKLVFYHRRLLNARPIDAVLKKTRMMLVNRLHARIASLSRNTDVSPKTLKKTRKIQEQARQFLTNV